MSDPHFAYELLFPNGKRYIGIAKNPKRRWNVHKFHAKNGSKILLYNAIRKYGWRRVKKKVLVAGSRSYIEFIEELLIVGLSTRYPHGYNLITGGATSPALSAEVKKKISLSKIEHWKDPRYRRKMLIHLRSGWKPTKTQRKKNSKAMKEKWQDPVYRARVVVSHTGKKDNDLTKKRKSRSIKKHHKENPQHAEISRTVMMGNQHTAGMIWINNGNRNRMIRTGEEIPHGWKRGTLCNWAQGHRRITNGTEERSLASGRRVPSGWWYGRKVLTGGQYYGRRMHHNASKELHRD